MLLRNILTTEECRLLVEEFDSSPTRQQEGDAFYRGSIGLYQPSASLALVERLQQQLEPVFGSLEFENSYLRAYLKGSILGIHTDRPGLDVTLSVCLEHEFEGEYPLWCSRQPFFGPWKDNLHSHELWTSDAVALELGLGDGAAMEGIRYPHWREEFKQDGRAVYIFFHWRRRRPPVTEPPRPTG
jgi:hypothetical protein